MNNFYISKSPYKRFDKPSFLFKLVQKGLRKLKIGELSSPLDPNIDMSTIEQRINYFHLLDNVITANVKGAVVELGSFTGQCAMIFQKVIQERKSNKELFLFDTFEMSFKETRNVMDVLVENFKLAKLRLPVMHKGYFQDTLPNGLPQEISFAHIDCGFGGDKLQHKDIILYCLTNIYDKMSKGAVCVLMDYYNPANQGNDFDSNPGVKLACDEFLKDKPEFVISLFSNQYNHGYFRKA